jgi:hypothetical protein
VYYAWTNWTPGEYSSASIGWTNNGVYIKTAAGAGLYQIIGNVSVAQNQNTEELEVEVWKGSSGVATQGLEKISGHTYMSVSGQPYAIPAGGFVRLVQNDYLELRFRNDTGAGRIASAALGNINFRMNKISN